MLEVDVLLQGESFRTSIGSPGFCSITLIRGSKLILVDSGHVGRRAMLIDALAQRGLRPEDIDVAVLTHAHWDHAQNFDLFTGAALLAHEDEMRYVRKPHRNDWATPRWTAAMLEFESKVETVTEGYEIEPGARILHTPGHSAGTMAVMVDTPNGMAAVTGDGIHSANAALSGRCPIVFWDEEASRRSIARVLETADAIYPGHGRPFRMLKDGSVDYLTPKDLTLSGFDPDEPGVAFDPKPSAQFVMPGIQEQRLE
ncbi:MAG: MBL fold metallo-hydrolase [Dehalococcoidia bacterium]